MLKHPRDTFLCKNLEKHSYPLTLVTFHMVLIIIQLNIVTLLSPSISLPAIPYSMLWIAVKSSLPGARSRKWETEQLTSPAPPPKKGILKIHIMTLCNLCMHCSTPGNGQRQLNTHLQRGFFSSSLLLPRLGKHSCGRFKQGINTAVKLHWLEKVTHSTCCHTIKFYVRIVLR